MNSLTGIPCPGCGLVRSMSAAARGDLALSWQRHPFGAAWLAVWVAIAAASVRPHVSQRLAAAHGQGLRTAAGLFVAAFLAFGALRAAYAAIVVGPPGTERPCAARCEPRAEPAVERPTFAAVP